jgi:hypothetical protein
LDLRITSCRIGSSSSFVRVPVDFEGSLPSMTIGYNFGAGVGVVRTILGTGVGVVTVVAGAVDLSASRDFGVLMAPVLSTDISCTLKASSSRGFRLVVPIVVLSAIVVEVVVGGLCNCQREDRKS